MKPVFHYNHRRDWSFTWGPITLDFESRYYRTCGLRLWFGWDHGPYVLRPYVPTEAENRALDARNAAAMNARRVRKGKSDG